MQKRWWMVGVAVCLCFALLLPAPALGAKNFKDIKGHWANSYIVNLSSKGYLNGYSDGSFKPDRSMTRAEFVTALINSLGIAPAAPSSNSFPDTKSHWAGKYIEEAVQRDIVIPSEYPAGFGPDQEILRSQAAAMLVRAMGLYASTGDLSFTDSNDVNRSIYRNQIKSAYDAGLMGGFPDGSFGPFKVMTRAQVCTVLVKMLEQNGSNTTPVNPQPVSGAITTVAVGEDLFTLGGSTKISFEVGSTYVTVSSLAVTDNNLTVNGNYVFALNNSIGNPEIIVGNTRFAIDRMTCSNNKLVVYPANRRINELSLNAHVYDSKNVKLYVKETSKDLYLSDLSISNDSEVVVNGVKYNLKTDKISIEANNKFYSISRIQLLPGNTVPVLTETDRVLFEGLTMLDFSSIKVGSKELDLDDINQILFLADGIRYRLSETTLDAYGTFTFNDETYRYNEVTMIIDSTNYKITKLELLKGKLVFTCQKTKNADQVKFNNSYIDYDEITILKGSSKYDFDEITIEERNVIRINNREYTIPSSDIQCEVDDEVWDIKKIEWSNSLDVAVITAEEAEDDFEPKKITLYDEDDVKLSDASSSKVKIEVDGDWISFSAIDITDENEFEYKKDSYKLIGSWVKINNDEYKIRDTDWHANTKYLDITLR